MILQFAFRCFISLLTAMTSLSYHRLPYLSMRVSRPEKTKVMRGSRDGFVETLVFNTALSSPDQDPKS